MTDQKKNEAAEIADEALEDAQGGYLKYQLKNVMVTSHSSSSTSMEEEEPIAMTTFDTKSLSAAFDIEELTASDIEKAGVLRRRPTR